MKFCPECAARLQTKTIDGVERVYCDRPDCGFVYWDNPVPVVAAIVNINDKILLAQNALWPQGRYSFITGYLERHELPEQAVIREVKEELGLDASVDRFIGHFIFQHKNQLLLVYSVNAHGTIRLNQELCDYKLFNTEDILEYSFSYPDFSQQIIKKYLSTQSTQDEDC